MRLIDHQDSADKVSVNLDDYKQNILSRSPKSPRSPRFIKNGDSDRKRRASIQRTDSDSSENGPRRSPTSGYSRYFQAIRGPQKFMKEVAFENDKKSDYRPVRRSESVKPLGHRWRDDDDRPDRPWQNVSMEQGGNQPPPPVPPRSHRVPLPGPIRSPTHFNGTYFSNAPPAPPPPPPKPSILPASVQIKKIEGEKRNRPPSINPVQTIKSKDADGLKPSVHEYEEHRRTALRSNIARAERFKGPWNVADYSSDTDNLSPQDKMKAIRTNYNTDDDTKGYDFGDGRYHSLVVYRKKKYQEETSKHAATVDTQAMSPSAHQDFHWWPGQRTQLSGSDTTNRVREAWEQRIQQHSNWNEEQQQRPHHQFKKWKSLDALSASLIGKEGQHLQPSELKPGEKASQIAGREPRNKPDPLFRLPINYLEREPDQHHHHPQQQQQQQMHMAAAAINHNGNPQWFDPGRIKDAISHESIANLGATKDRWEQRVEQNMNSGDNKQQQHNGMIITDTNRSVTPIQYYGRGIHDMHDNEMVETRRIEHEMSAAYHPHQMSPLQQRDSQRSERSVKFGSDDEHQQHQSVSDSELEKDKQLFLQYLNCRPDVVQGLGLMIPWPMRQRIMAIGPHGPKVVLQQVQGVAGETGWYKTYYGTHDGYGSRAAGRATSPNSNGYDSQTSTLERARGGRYIKNASSTNTVPRRAPVSTKAQNGSAKRTWARVEPVTPPAADRRSEHESGPGAGGGSSGENMIAREIRDLKDREEDLKRSRSELGLPNLEDVFEMWKEKGGDEQKLRSAKSVDHLHLVDPHQNENQQRASLNSMQFRAGSLDHLHQAHLNDIEGKSFQATSPASKRKAHNQSPLDYTPHRTQALPPPKADARENGYHQQSSGAPHPRVAKDIEFALAREDSLRKARATTPKLNFKGLGPSAKYLANVAETNEPDNDEDVTSSGRRTAPTVPSKPQHNGQLQRPLMSPTGSAGRKSPYEKFLAQHHPTAKTHDLPYNENRDRGSSAQHVPVETRIEREVKQLQMREAELKSQRASTGVHYSPIALQVNQESESDGASNGSTEQVRSREYVGQRNPGFNPVYSDDAFSPVSTQDQTSGKTSPTRRMTSSTPSTSLLRSPYSDRHLDDDNDEVHLSDTEADMIEPGPSCEDTFQEDVH